MQDDSSTVVPIQYIIKIIFDVWQQRSYYYYFKSTAKVNVAFFLLDPVFCCYHYFYFVLSLYADNNMFLLISSQFPSVQQKICFMVESGGGGGADGGGDFGGGDRNNKTFATSDRARLREKPPPAWLVTIIRPAKHVRNPLTAARCGLSSFAKPVATCTMWPRIVGKIRRLTNN